MDKKAALSPAPTPTPSSLSRKKQPPPPPASPGSVIRKQPPVICVVLSHPESRVYEYSLYCLEAEKEAATPRSTTSSSKPLPEPLFRCKQDSFTTFPGFGALGSKVYVFGGLTTIPHLSDEESHRLDTYVFDTVAAPPPPSSWAHPEKLLLDPNNKFLSQGPKLNHPKVDPIVVTFEDKIFVFPSYVMCSIDTSYNYNTCEVLDACLGWKELPPIPLNLLANPPPAKSYVVQSYMLHKSVFIARISDGNTYSLNLSNPDKWSRDGHAVSSLPFGGKGVCMDTNCFAVVYPLILAKFDDFGEGGFGMEHRKVFDMEPLPRSHCSQPPPPLKSFGWNPLGQDKLCLVTTRHDIEHYFSPDISNTLGFYIFQVGEKDKTKENKNQKLSGTRLLPSSSLLKKKKKENQQETPLLSSSTFTMRHTKEFLGYGDVLACFPLK